MSPGKSSIWWRKFGGEKWSDKFFSFWQNLRMRALLKAKIASKCFSAGCLPISAIWWPRSKQATENAPRTAAWKKVFKQCGLPPISMAFNLHFTSSSWPSVRLVCPQHAAHVCQASAMQFTMTLLFSCLLPSEQDFACNETTWAITALALSQFFYKGKSSFVVVLHLLLTMEE